MLIPTKVVPIRRFILTTVCIFSNFQPGVKQILGYILVMSGGHVLGWWLDWDASRSHAVALTSTKDVIQARVKLECEKEQQEQLLLSVIPAYIAHEVGLYYLVYVMIQAYTLLYRSSRLPILLLLTL